MELSTHAGRLERWLGAEECERASHAMKGWYGPPVAVAGVPGRVYVGGDGDFRGPIQSGQLGNLFEFMVERKVRQLRRMARLQMFRCNAGFSGLDDLIQEVTINGKLQDMTFLKTGSTQVVGWCSSLWQNAGIPAAGAAGSAAPGGRAPTSATTGAFPYTNAAGGDTCHFLGAHVNHSIGGSCLLYDRIFDVAKTMSSTATQAVTGVPTRYQNQTATEVDYIGGNFCFTEVFAALGATAHNWTVCQYTDQDGNATQSFPSVAGVSSAPINTLDLPAATWFMPLASGDRGVKALTQMQCSASVTGTLNFVLGHPIAYLPCPLGLRTEPINAIKDAFQLTRIFDSACLALLNLVAVSTSAPGIAGAVHLGCG